MSFVGRWFTPPSNNFGSNSAAYIAPASAGESVQSAAATAKEESARKKRMRSLAGGKTILTDESPTLSGGMGKTLLGG